MMGKRRIAGPTKREIEILAYVVAFGTYKEAARALEMTESSVKNALCNVHMRTGLTTVQAVWVYRKYLGDIYIGRVMSQGVT